MTDRADVIYRGVFAAMPVPATLIDAQGLIVDVNEAFLELAHRYGLSVKREDRVGFPLWQFSGEADPQLGKQALETFLRDGTTESWRRAETDDSGREGQHDMQLVALRDATGQIAGALVLRQEVTESVEQARQLEESLQLLAALRVVGHLVLSSLDLEIILDMISREIVKAGIFRSLTLSLVDEPSHSVEVVRSFVHALNSEGDVIPGSALSATDNVVGLRYDLDEDNIMAETARTGQVIVTDADDSRFDSRVRVPVVAQGRACYFIPVKRGDRVVAVLATGSTPAQRDSTMRRIEAMGPLLDQVAIAIEHGRLYRETRRSEQDARVSLAVQQVRTEILQMQTDEDWSRVVLVLRRELRSLLDYSACGINLLTPAGMHSFSSGHGVRDEVRGQQLPAPVAEAVRTGQPCYRRTPEQMEAMGDNPKLLAAGIQSVVDIPFDTGTLAMNSTRANAFSDNDIEVLQQFAGVMAEGHRRLQDLRALATKERQLQQAQKMEAVGQLTAGIAHNFNNMLQAMTGNLDLARMDAPPEVRRLLGNALETGYRAAQMVQQLMVYARQTPQQPVFETVQADSIIEDVAGICQRTFPRDIVVVTDAADDLPAAAGSAMQLEQVLLNFCINSRDAVEGIRSARIELEARGLTLPADRTPQGLAAGTYLRLRVLDNGPGMDENTRKRIFEPFFTTKDVDKGTGLGLSTALGIAEEHGGWIECNSAPGEGACFDLFLPAAEDVNPQPKDDRHMTQGTGSETVLVIDDEEMVRHTAIQMLERRGFRTLTAADGQEGLEVFEQHRDEIDLILLDHSMPRMSGQETLQALRQLDVSLPIVIITGFPTRLKDFVGATDLVQKPFSLDGLAGLIRDVLDRPA